MVYRAKGNAGAEVGVRAELGVKVMVWLCFMFIVYGCVYIHLW